MGADRSVVRSPGSDVSVSRGRGGGALYTRFRELSYSTLTNGKINVDSDLQLKRYDANSID